MTWDVFAAKKKSVSATCCRISAWHALASVFNNFFSKDFSVSISIFFYLDALSLKVLHFKFNFNMDLFSSIIVVPLLAMEAQRDREIF